LQGLYVKAVHLCEGKQFTSSFDCVCGMLLLLLSLAHQLAICSIYKQYILLLDEVFVISRIIKDITKTESNKLFYYTLNEKNESHVFASSLMASNTKRANLT